MKFEKLIIRQTLKIILLTAAIVVISVGAQAQEVSSKKSTSIRPEAFKNNVVNEGALKLKELFNRIDLPSFHLIPDARAAEKKEGKKHTTAGALFSPEQMADSLENVLASHRTEFSALKTRMEQLDSLKGAILNEIKAYDSQNTAHSQLLLVSQLRIESLESALKNNRLAYKTLSERFQELSVRYDANAIVFTQTTDRIELARKQITDIRQAELPKAQKQKLEAAIRELIQVLKEKKQLGDRFLRFYEDLMGQVKIASDENKALGEKLGALLESRKKTSFLKQSAPRHGLTGKAVSEELRFSWNHLKSVFSPVMWRAQWAQIKMGGFVPWAIFLAALAAIIALQNRCRVVFLQIEERYDGPEWYYRRLGSFLLRHSLLYFGMVLLFGSYSSLQVSLLDAGLARVLFMTFLVLLLTRWGLDFLGYEHSRSPTSLWSFVSLRLKRLFRLLRVIFIFGILLRWLAGKDSLLIWLTHDVVVIGLLAWTVVFWRRLPPVVTAGGRLGQAAPSRQRVALLRGWSYLVIGGGLLISVVGYSTLSQYWVVAWIKTLALLFWGWITLNVIREWHRDHKTRSAAADEKNPLSSAHHLRGSLIQLVRVAWFLSLARGIIWAWDSSDYLMSRVITFFDLTYTIGSLKFSIEGTVLAAVILFTTHLTVRIGRNLVSEKMLEKKHLEPGFKHSILTITSYLGWGIGLLLALGTIGVNATSLAVVFGALSVGIGFGLQNIFNNFISGLILLFERPIQVGDYIEVGSLWAEVKKINVRATVVQTFDNASVIIPNSEFISQQVTNWSFKDRRMRRNIEVGVAYGSDIDLVEKTMLEIAHDRKKVLKVPRPDVLFIDHAASALIFRLRIWVHVDDYWAVPSKIRYEIDRRFRELGIEIAFPQQDIHIRSGFKEETPVDDPG